MKVRIVNASRLSAFNNVSLPVEVEVDRIVRRRLCCYVSTKELTKIEGINLEDYSNQEEICFYDGEFWTCDTEAIEFIDRKDSITQILDNLPIGGYIHLNYEHNGKIKIAEVWNLRGVYIVLCEDGPGNWELEDENNDVDTIIEDWKFTEIL